MFAVVSRVQNVCTAILKSHPPQLMIDADGIVPTSGWGSEGSLLPWVYVSRPSDGILDFTFVGTAPTGIVNPVEKPISASAKLVLESWIKGVRVHATADPPIEVAIADQSCSFTGIEVQDGQVPWPWSRELTASATTEIRPLGLDDDLRRELQNMANDIVRWNRECSGDINCVVDRAISELKDRRCRQSNDFERGVCNASIELGRVAIKTFILGMI